MGWGGGREGGLRLQKFEIDSLYELDHEKFITMIYKQHISFT